MPFLGFGCDFQLSTNGGSTYASVGSVVDITVAGFKAGDVQTTSIQLTTPWHTFQAKLGDGGVIKFKLIYQKTQYQTILNNFRVNNLFKLIFSDVNVTASTLVISGYINEIPITLPLEDMIVTEVSVKVSGQPVFTPGT